MGCSPRSLYSKKPKDFFWRTKQEIKQYQESTDYSKDVRAKTDLCECGKIKHGFMSHSTWCPLYEPPKWRD